MFTQKPPLNPLFFITAIKPTICSKFSRAFGTHQDPFYQWRHLMLFTASFLMRLQKNYCSINWGKVVALIAVHFRSPSMNVYEPAGRQHFCLQLQHYTWYPPVILNHTRKNNSNSMRSPSMNAITTCLLGNCDSLTYLNFWSMGNRGWSIFLIR